MLLKKLLPSVHLAHYIKEFWILENNGPEITELVHPTGEMQFLFHYGLPFYKRDTNGKISQQPRFLIGGQATSYNYISCGPEAGVIGVVFHPHSASCFLPFPVNEITGINLELDDVLSEWRDYTYAFLETDQTDRRIQLIEKFFLEILVIHNHDKFKLIASCVQDVRRANGLINPGTLIKKYHITERTLERVFADLVGLPPKKYADLVRLNYAIRLCRSKLSLAEIGFRAGYYDQSHFIKTLKRYTGLTPAALRSPAPTA